MTLQQMTDLFKKYGDGNRPDYQFLEYKRDPDITEPIDLFAFNLLHRLVPSPHDLVGAAEHDEIWIDVRAEKLAAVVSEEQILQLVRCGLMLDDEQETFKMYV